MNNRAAALDRWEQYNWGMGLGDNPGLQIGDCFYRLPKNYTDLFFDGLSLMDYANTECKRWVQFGASNGIFLAERQNEACTVVGYDYSHNATVLLECHGVSARQVDINNTDDQSNLSCQNQVGLDLMQPCNLLVIRLLEYLTPDAKILFLHLLIEKSQPGSVFFLSEATWKDAKEESSDHHSGYIKTFFTTRTDFEYLFFARTADKNNQDKLLLVENLQKYDMEDPPQVDDHIMVFKKI